MEENLHKDNLESFFNKAFDKLPDTPTGDDWDMPSDDVWIGVQENMTVAQKPIFSKKNIGLLLLLLIVLGGILFLFYRNKQLVENLRLQKNEIATLNDSLQKGKIKEGDGVTIKEKENTIKEKAIVNPMVSEGEGEENGKNDTSQLSVNNIKSTQKGQENEVLEHQSKTKKSISSQKQENAFNGKGKNNIDLVSIENKNEFLDKKVLESREVVAPLALPFAINLDKKVEKIENRLLTTEVIKRKRIQFFAGLYISPNFSVNSARLRGGGRPIFKKYEKSEWSNEKGLKLGVKLGNHWKITTGLGRYSSILTSRQLVKVAYENPEIIGDDVQTTYGLKIESSYGTSDVDVDLRHSNMYPFMLGENIALDVRSRQELHFLNIPLLLGYEIKKGRLTFDIQAGIALNVLKQSIFEAEIEPRHPRLRRHERPRVVKKFDISYKKGLDYMVSAGVSYALTPSFRLSFEPVFRKNITPINNTADFSNKLYSVGIHAGGYYYF